MLKKKKKPFHYFIYFIYNLKIIVQQHLFRKKNNITLTNMKQMIGVNRRKKNWLIHIIRMNYFINRTSLLYQIICYLNIKC